MALLFYFSTNCFVQYFTKLLVYDFLEIWETIVVLPYKGFWRNWLRRQDRISNCYDPLLHSLPSLPPLCVLSLGSLVCCLDVPSSCKPLWLAGIWYWRWSSAWAIHSPLCFPVMATASYVESERQLIFHLTLGIIGAQRVGLDL